MSVAIHDSGATGKLGWAETAVRSCGVSRVFLSPFETPPKSAPRRPSAAECIQRLSGLGAQVLFDPTTHALTARTNHTEHYNRWKLWGRRDPTSDVECREHVRRCLEHQQTLNVVPMVPTLSLQYPNSPQASRVLAMAELGLKTAPDAILSLAGVPGFWAAGPSLDDLVGEFAQLRPREVVLTVVHEVPTYPPSLGPNAVEGLCRTTQSFSLRSRVSIAHGDFAALPAAAAGAVCVGTGWHLGQRRFSPDGVVKVDGIRRSPERVTHREILSVLKKPEAAKLQQNNSVLAAQLRPGVMPPDGPSQWQEHLRAIGTLVKRIHGAGADQKSRVAALKSVYQNAYAHYPNVRAGAGALEHDQTTWIDPFSNGLNQYATAEGY